MALISDLWLVCRILWYELLAGKWPYTRQRVERSIYQIGACLKPSLSPLSISQSTRVSILCPTVVSCLISSVLESLCKVLGTRSKKATLIQ